MEKLLHCTACGVKKVWVLTGEGFYADTGKPCREQRCPNQECILKHPKEYCAKFGHETDYCDILFGFWKNKCLICKERY